MKKNFCGFYSTSENELENVWNEGSTLFVLDANCLLNLYRCEDGTREDILKVMKELSPRLWIPFQVGYEYQKNRRNVIDESISSLLKIKLELEKYYNQSILEQAGIKKHLYNKLSNELSEFQQELSGSIDKFINVNIDIRIKNKQSIAKHDFIRDELDTIINENVGAIPTQEKINEINNAGEKRYEKKIPPGFKDVSKKKGVSYFSDLIIEDKFGDLYLWEQLIEKASSENIETVIFVTDDAKDDWVFIHKGVNHGPLESLKTEICKRSSLKNFRLINQLSFLREAQSYLKGINVSDETLDEVKELVLSPVYEQNDNSLYHLHFDTEIYEHYETEKEKSNLKRHGYSFSSHGIINIREITELVNRSEVAIDLFEMIKFRAHRILKSFNIYQSDLNDSYGESTVEYFIKNLTTILRQASRLATMLKNRDLPNVKYSEINENELNELVEDLEQMNLKLELQIDETTSFFGDIM